MSDVQRVFKEWDRLLKALGPVSDVATSLKLSEYAAIRQHIVALTAELEALRRAYAKLLEAAAPTPPATAGED